MNVGLNSAEIAVKEFVHTQTSTSSIASAQISLDWFRMWLYPVTLLFVEKSERRPVNDIHAQKSTPGSVRRYIHTDQNLLSISPIR